MSRGISVNKMRITFAYSGYFRNFQLLPQQVLLHEEHRRIKLEVGVLFFAKPCKSPRSVRGTWARPACNYL